MKDSLGPLLAKAYQLQQKNELAQAIQLYEQILVQDAKHQECMHLLGLAHAQLGNINQAISYFLQAKDLDPKDPVLLNNLANAYKKNNQWDEAIASYVKAIELKPNYAQAHNNLATIYSLQNKYQQALQHYAKAVQSEPDYAPAHFNLGLLLLQNRQLSAAKTQFNNVLTLNPDHQEARFYLGVLYLEENALPKAQDYFQKVLDSEPEHVQALINLGVVALKNKENQLAVDYFSKALALDNEHMDARNNLAATFMHYDRFENALMHYDVLLKKEPNNLEYLYNSGVAQMALGHLNEAIIFFENLLTLQERHAPSLQNLAAIYLKMEQRETAQEYLRQALAIDPEDTVSRHMLNALAGTQNAATNTEYAHNLFNNYALYYEQHMQGPLHYSVPKYIGRMVHELGLTQIKKTLDLGCGTGLTGVVVREASTHLTGVDIAEKMISHAEEKGIYDLLVRAELIDFLKKDKKHYGLILAADVLPYFGSLDELFDLIEQHLQKNAYFIFTTEISTTTPWFLETSARFSHHPDYVHNLIKSLNLQLIKQEKIPARMHQQQLLEVMLFVVKKADS